MNKQFNGRDFQFWEYRVSHGQLLIRSPKSPTQDVNVDLVFAGVEYAALPRHLLELKIEDATELDVSVVAERLGRPVKKNTITILIAQGTRHIVVAAAVKVAESNMDIFDSPFPK